jgi:DNA-binding LacI/PurR family transcriptional regulator
MSRKRPTIGLLTTMDLIHIFPSHWLGVADAARRLGVNLLCFTGVTLRSTIQNSGFANTIFDRISARDVDGLVVWPSALEWYVGRAEMLAFCQRYKLPLVCAETPLEGFSSVTIDGRQGMREAVSHLIEIHGLRRIAFLGGPGQHRRAVGAR